jgi:hypothetical protein
MVQNLYPVQVRDVTHRPIKSLLRNTLRVKLELTARRHHFDVVVHRTKLVKECTLGYFGTDSFDITLTVERTEVNNKKMQHQTHLKDINFVQTTAEFFHVYTYFNGKRYILQIFIILPLNIGLRMFGFRCMDKSD